VTVAELSDIQHGVWLTEQAGVAGTAFHLALAVRFTGALDEAALAVAVDAVVDRHPALAGAVAPGDDGPRIAPARTRPRLTRTAPTDDLVDTEVTRPFDLAHGPLVRFVLAADVLLVVAHHLVFDGMSKDILVRDLAAAYAATHRGHPWTPPALPAAPDDEPARIAALLPAARSYWAGWREPAVPPLPGLTRVPAGGEAGAMVPFTLDEETVTALDAAGATLRASRFELLLCAVQTLLARYGDPAPVVAVDVSTRTAATADRIGLYVNELPVRSPGGATFRAAVGALRARLREVYRFRSVPFGHAVGGLRPRTALAPVGISYRRRGPDPEFPGVAATVRWQIFHHGCRGALHLQLVDHGPTVTAALHFNPAAIDADDVVRTATHLRILLAAALADPDRPLVDLPLLAAEEAEHDAAHAAGPVRDRPAGTVADLFAARADAHPDAPALTDGVRTYDYAGLAAAVDDLAGRLRARGVGRGDLVAVCLARSARLVTTVLAVLRAGAAYLPIDPTHPPARQALVLDDARPVLVLTDTPDAGHLAGPWPVHDPLRLPDAAPVDRATATGADLAYVMYTSGSTGRPKGVPITHAALANELHAMAEVLGSGPADAWLSLAALSFDISALELFLPLVTGGRVVLGPADGVRDAAGACRAVAAHGVTHVQATPSGWRLLLDAAPDGLRLARVALIGGEALPTALAERLLERVDRLVNVYGPTETTVWATTAEVTNPADVHIGAPLANLAAYVLDATLRPVPPGVAGELYLGGVGVAPAYLGRPALTAHRFVPDPHGAPGARMYRTGDRVHRDPAGRLHFLGRVDNQVKIRGNRVELGEVEARLLAHPAVAHAAAALRTVRDEPVLVGYLVPAPDRSVPDPAQLRAFAAATLTTAMVPGAWVVLDRLPLSPNGKVDRAALPDPAVTDPEPAPAPAGPADELVEEVRRIWQEVLRVDTIGLDDDLFDLGGHSLTVTRIKNRMQKHLGVSVPLAVFFDTPTIGDVCAVIRAGRSARPSTEEIR
jgi:amino acid adenylation domain-containing protein